MLSDVLEQEEGVRFLRRVVDGHFTSPLLLVGNEGVGRRFAVIQAAKEIFCTVDRTNVCPCMDCAQINHGTHPDFIVLSPEGDKEIGVEIIRSVVQSAGARPTVAPCKIILIDGVDRLTNAAANAILKTLEEPPSMVRFFLLAESQMRVIPTIRSRCGLVTFSSLSETLILSVLQRFESDPDKALVYARLSEGSVGCAVRYWGSGRLVLRDQTFSLLRFALSKDIAGLFSAVDSMEKELLQVLRFLSLLLHDLLMISIDPTRVLNLDLRADMSTLNLQSGSGLWQRLLQSVNDLRERTRTVKLFLPFHVKTIFAQTIAAG